jgi:hypothetical protein
MSGELVIHGRAHILARDAAIETGLSRDYLSRLARDGRVPADRLSIGWLFDLEALRAFVAERKLRPRFSPQEPRSGALAS